MRKYHQLLLIVVCLASVITLLVYRHQYNRLRYVLEVLNFFGKTGGTTNDPCFLNATFERRGGSERAEPLFQRLDDSRHVYSAFWRRADGSADAIVVAVVAPAGKRQSFKFKCHLLVEDEDRPVPGKFGFTRLEPKAAVREDYAAFVFHCRPAAAPSVRPYAVSFYPDSDADPLSSPVVRLFDDGDDATDATDAPDRVTFRNNFKIVACVMPARLPTVTKRNVVEFLAFHRLLGIAEFQIYDNSLPPGVLGRLRLLPEEATGISLRALPFNFPYATAGSYHTMRDVAELDCARRALDGRAGHVVHLSWDEYVVPRYHRLLRPLIEKYDADNKSRLQIPTLHFCLNQKSDPKARPGHPSVVEKTHYDKSVAGERPSYIYGAASADGGLAPPPSAALQNERGPRRTEKLPQDIVAVHKYVDCKEPNRGFKNVDVDFSDLETRPHQFEGAMIRFADDFFATRLYTLFRTEKIWSPLKEKPA